MQKIAVAYQGDMDTLSFFLTAVVLLGIPTAKKNEDNQ